MIGSHLEELSRVKGLERNRKQQCVSIEPEQLGHIENGELAFSKSSLCFCSLNWIMDICQILNSAVKLRGIWKGR